MSGALGQRFAGKRVLVAENSWHVARVLQLYLAQLGMVVSTAGRLEDAERLVAEQVFDLALLDNNLRGGTTHTLMERLKKLGVRVVAISGYPMSELSVPAADATLQEPYGGRELSALLSKLFP
jgi:CheY-like chemotaxis protein